MTTSNCNYVAENKDVLFGDKTVKISQKYQLHFYGHEMQKKIDIQYCSSLIRVNTIILIQ